MNRDPLCILRSDIAGKSDDAMALKVEWLRAAMEHLIYRGDLPDDVWEAMAKMNENKKKERD